MFNHYETHKQDIDFFNYKKIFKKNKNKIINKIKIDNIMRMLLYIFNIYLSLNYTALNICDLNTNFKFKNSSFFYEIEFNDFLEYIFYI